MTLAEAEKIVGRQPTGAVTNMVTVSDTHPTLPKLHAAQDIGVLDALESPHTTHTQVRRDAPP